MARELEREERDLEQKAMDYGQELVKELLEARALFLGRENKVKEAVKKSSEFENMPVVALGKDSPSKLMEEAHQKTVRELIRDGKRLRGFGAALNLDGSLAANIDRATARAERAGFDSKEEKMKVRKVVIDHSSVYRNSTDAEKDMGIARESLYRVDTPNRDNVQTVLESVVLTPLKAMENAIDWSKYDKWNEMADRERETREERNTREERDYEREVREREERENAYPSFPF
jgi:hypothetical protein